MNHPVRFLTVLAALGLLVAVFAVSGTTTVQAEPDDDEVGWVSMGSGDDISFVKAGINAVFLIKDDALEVIQSGKATFTGLEEGDKYINLADGSAGADSNVTAASSTAMRMFDAASIGYAGWDGSEATASSHTGDGTATPLVNDVVNTRNHGQLPSRHRRRRWPYAPDRVLGIEGSGSHVPVPLPGFLCWLQQGRDSGDRYRASES